MSLRLYPFSVLESRLRDLANYPASQRCAFAQDGAREVWPLSDEFANSVCRAAEQIFDDIDPDQSDRGASVAAAIGLALAGAGAERLSGTIEDWKAAVLDDFAPWASPKMPRAAAILPILVAGRDLNGRAGPGAGEPRYTLLTQSETSVLANDLAQLTENGGLENAGELTEFVLDLLSWSEACSNHGCSLLLAIL